MRRQQWVVLGVALGASIVLWNFPRVVVENDAVAMRSQIDSVTTEHVKMSSEQKNRIDSLKHYLSTSAYKASLDSLIAIFQRFQMYDSAGFYAEYVAKRFPSKELFKQAGDLYYEAYTYALNSQKEMHLSEKVREMFQKAQQLGENNPDMQVKIGMTYVNSATPMQGIQMIRDVLAQHPRHRLALLNLGILSMQSGQYEKAIERFETLKTIDSTDVQTRIYLGVCWYKLKKYQQAKQELEIAQTLTQDPQALATIDAYLQPILTTSK
ncbi:MAG: tetratricopeptide repeat protein [Cytophagales bacterium]|nr:tetratricopeptide repeat protein [Cytophagales bacterium]MDW8385299.1 tetratricopeptide repeat protein [Flammeovirgaceae bacterium]